MSSFVQKMVRESVQTLRHVTFAPQPINRITVVAPHVRDAMNLARVSRYMLLALAPCALVGLFNTGYQANVLMAQAGLQYPAGWHGAVMQALGFEGDPTSLVASLGHGLLIVLPVLLAAVITAALWEHVFVSMRGGGHRGDFLLIAVLFTLSLPPAVPLWQVALGMTFGVVIGKEIFGGTGMNFLHPALVGLAFLYVTYPASMVGETAWAVHGLSGATPMQTDTQSASATIEWIESTWMQSFLGLVPGAIGATSTLACFVGALVLFCLRLISMHIVAGVLLGTIAATAFFNIFGDPANSYAMLAWHWHLVLGSLTFGTVFLATDPASSAMTDTGRWIYGALIGFMMILLRVANPAHPDGIMFAILFGNILAPLIDYGVMAANIRRRRKRDV